MARIDLSGGFQPFSLAKSIQENQAINLNKLKLATLQDAMDRKRDLRQMASESTKPTYEDRPVYGEAEGPPTREGETPQIQTGTEQVQTGEEFDPEAMQQKAGAAGDIETFAKMQDVRDKMQAAEKEEFDQKILSAAQTAFTADSPEKWQAEQYAGNIPRDQGFEKREFAINAGRKIEDLMKTTAAKAPTTRKVKRGTDIVTEEWVPATQSWKEVGRGPMSQQQINLRNKPSEVAAGKEFQTILDQANISEDQLAVVHRAKALLPTIETGKLEPIKKWAREWGDAFGVPIDTEKMTDAVSFRAVMKTAVLDGMRSIKGTASEADRKTVEDSIAALDSPELANEFLLDVSESMARRKIEQANFWDRYAAANNSSLLGAKSAWSKRISDIPLIKKVKGEIHHYYKFKDQAIKANKAAFRNATEDEVNQYIDDMWMRGE